MDKNIEQVKDFRKNRGEKSYIIYINTIGSYSDEHMNKLFKCFEKINSTKRVRRGNYGTFKARKYSFKVAMDEAIELREAIYRRINFDQKDKIRILVENVTTCILSMKLIFRINGLITSSFIFARNFHVVL